MMATAQLGAVLEYLRSMPADGKWIEETDGALLRAFLNDHHQGAFEALLRRHGAMVLRVCQRALGQAHDAEDAFQATFLVLAQRASSIRKQESLASWLHGVAYRMATNMKRAASRRHKYEARANRGRAQDPALCAAWQEIQGLLDQEILALPEPVRQAFVYCCLENRSCAEAARLIGVEQGTVEMRLTRARRQLRARLARRGVELSTVLAATALGADGLSAAVRPSLVRSLVKAVMGLAAGRDLGSGLVSSKLMDLVKGAQEPMFFCTTKTTTVLILCALGVASVGFGPVRHALSNPQPPDRQAAQQALDQSARPVSGKAQSHPRAAAARPSTTAEKPVQDVLTVRGRVFDPDGKPVADAKLYLGHYGPKDEVAVTERAKSDADGRFEFRFPRSQLSKSHPDRPFEFRFPRSQLSKSHPDRPIGRTYGATTPERFEPQPRGEANPYFTPVGQVMAVGEGYGCDWVRVDAAAGSAELTLRLVKDVPIRGRILDQEGKPVAGAKLRLSSVQAYAGEKLEAALAAFRKSSDFPGGVKRWGGPLPSQAKIVTTGQDGRFRMAGLGGERYVHLHVEGPGIASTDFQVITRLGDTVVGPDKIRAGPDPRGAALTREFRDIRPNKIHGATFRYLAASSRPIRGVVTDKVTGKPLDGVMIRVAPRNAPLDAGIDYEFMLTTHSDGQGRYEIVGCPKSPYYKIAAHSSDTGRYFAVVLSEVPDTSGIGPMTIDVQLPRGIPIRGKVLDERTGKPIAGARVNCFRLFPNAAAVIAFRDYNFAGSNAITGLDGSFAVVGLPGPGLLVASAPDSTMRGRSTVYLPGKVTGKEWDDFVAKYKVPPQGVDYPWKKWDDAEKCEVVEYATIVVSNSSYFILQFNCFNSLALLHPDEKDKELKLDLKLRPNDGNRKFKDEDLNLKGPGGSPRMLKKKDQEP